MVITMVIHEIFQCNGDTLQNHQTRLKRNPQTTNGGHPAPCNFEDHGLIGYPYENGFMSIPQCGKRNEHDPCFAMVRLVNDV